jgi:mannose-6-phosphate isomerase-like protein (cupin superfamily)
MSAISIAPFDLRPYGDTAYAPFSRLRDLSVRLVRAGKSTLGEPLDIYGSLIYPKVTGEDTGGRYAILENVVPAFSGPPLHVHHLEDEAFFVLEGSFVFKVGEQLLQANQGDFLIAPKHTPHCFQNVGAAPGKLLLMVEPAGLEVFFADLAAIPGPPDPARVVPVFHKHGLELLGPPLGQK